MNNDCWHEVEELQIGSRKSITYSFGDLHLSEKSLEYLNSFFPNGIYLHQKEAIKSFLNNENVCLSTGTASGKSLAFYIPGIEVLSRDAGNKIIAIYPLKSLGREQETKWRDAVEKAGLDINVGRIDGQVSTSQRKAILKECGIVIITPDVIHAWLLPNIDDSNVVQFVRSVSLIVVDEVHTYTGVFGSNSAFLFRRMRHLMELLDCYPQFIAASATIANPEVHIKNLFGMDFRLIGQEYDTSPRYEVNVIMINLPKVDSFLTEVSKALTEISSLGGRFIAFVDSRKQTELISSILSRESIPGEDEERMAEFSGNHLENLDILPYRAGYEEHDRDIIQERLSKGLLKGVVSTSALELGLDIRGLDTAILVGVPYSGTSFLQRIGRIGRHGKSTVYIINTGSIYDELIFKNPDQLLTRPLTQSSLYLENPRIQYIHTLCLARHGGEHDRLCSYLNNYDEYNFKSQIDWPGTFISLCRSERLGEIPSDLQAMKMEAGDDPNHIYPLRDAESQFKVALKHGPNKRSMGSLSYSQLLRETYPGAIYYYTTKAYRVYKVNVYTHEVLVRPEKKYTTSPLIIPAIVFPNLTYGNVYRARKHGDLVVSESNLQVRESVNGFDEKRGPNKKSYLYPLDYSKISIYFDRSRFTRNYFTSGVVFTHPSLNNESLNRKDLENIASLIYEAFLILIPFERQEINWAVGRHMSSREHVNEGDRFIAIFDRTYGSLRLSGYLMDENHMEELFIQALEVAEINNDMKWDTRVMAIIKDLYSSSRLHSMQIVFDSDSIENTSACREKIIMPGSIGLALHKSNEEFMIESVFFNPSFHAYIIGAGTFHRGEMIIL